jgi:hypothetical protein
MRRPPTEDNLKSMDYCVVMPCNLQRPRRFRGTYRLHIQGRRVQQAGNQKQAASYNPEDCALHIHRRWNLKHQKQFWEELNAYFPFAVTLKENLNMYA